MKQRRILSMNIKDSRKRVFLFFRSIAHKCSLLHICSKTARALQSLTRDEARCAWPWALINTCLWWQDWCIGDVTARRVPVSRSPTSDKEGHTGPGSQWPHKLTLTVAAHLGQWRARHGGKWLIYLAENKNSQCTLRIQEGKIRYNYQK